jgi:UTP:GlnB (protein PII) uridylyltransferase
MASQLDIYKWMAGYDTGMSSKAIAMHMSAGWCNGNYPYDPADLGRCLRLLELFPEWKPRIAEMAQYGKVWAAYISRWDEIVQSMVDEVGIDWSKGQRAEKTYGLMHDIARSA